MNSLSLIRNSHVSHDMKWMVTGGQCIACLADIIEDPTVLQVKKKVAVDELLRLINNHADEMLCILSYECQVTLHLTLMLLELLCRGQLGDSLESAVIEAEVRILSMLQSDDLLSVVMETISQQCTSACNYKHNLVLFTLTGKLFSVAPNLPRQVLQFHGSYVEHIISALSYTDQSVQIEASFLCIQLYSAVLAASRSSSESLMPDDLVQRLVRDTVTVLHGSSDADLQVNLLGLMRVLLQDDRTHEAFLGPQAESLSLMLTIKKLLLGHQVSLQVSVSQCLIYLLRGRLGAEFAASLLQEDMAEFLFEALHCTNDLIIGSLFCVLLLLTDCPVFFSGCHSVYGVESVLRSIDYVLKIQHTESTEQGFQLLANILERHRSGVRLFGSASVKMNCLDVIRRGLQVDQSGVFLSAWNAFKHLLRYDHLHPVLPLKDIVGIVDQTVNRFMNRTISWRHPRKPLVAGMELETHRLLQKHLPSSVLYSIELNAVILQLARVVSCCCKEQALDDSTFHGPHSSLEPYTFDDFCQWLLQTILRICLPLTLKHCETVTTGLRVEVVFLDLLSALHILYVSLPPRDSHSLDADLVRSGFLGLLMKIKTQSQSCPELNNITIQLLLVLLDCGVFGAEDDLNDAERSGARISLKEGLCLCNGRLEDAVTQLQADVAYGGSSYPVIWNRVIALLYLLYTAYCHSDRCTKPNTVQTFIRLLLQVHQHGATLPRTVLRCSVYLLAEAVCEAENLAGTIDLHPIVTSIQQHEDIGVWCVKSPLVLRWSFNEESVYSIYSKQVLLFFINNGFEKDVEELGARNIPCTKALVNLIAFSEDRHVVYTTLNILKALLTKANDEEDEGDVGRLETRSFLQSYLPDVTQKTFLLPARDMPAENMSVLIEVLAASRSLSDESIATQELKIVDYVQSLLKKPSSSTIPVDGQELNDGVDKLYHQSINYLNVLLVKSIEQKDDRVAMLLAGSVSLCRYLSQVISGCTDVVQSSTHCKALFCVALMQMTLSSSPSPSILNSVTLTVDLTQFLSCVNLKPIDATIRFLLLSTIFSGVSSQTNFVRLVNSGKDPREFDEPIHGLPVTNTHLRTLYITLQNSLLKEDEALSAAALCCLNNLFKVIEKTQEIYDHLLSQPWNHFLLDIVLSRLNGFGVGAKCSSLASLGVLNLMLTWNPSLFVSHRTEAVIDVFLRFSVADNELCSVMFARVVKEMMAKGIVSTDQRQKTDDRLQEIEMTTTTARYEDFESTVRLARLYPFRSQVWFGKSQLQDFFRHIFQSSRKFGNCIRTKFAKMSTAIANKGKSDKIIKFLMKKSIPEDKREMIARKIQIDRHATMCSNKLKKKYIF